MTERARRDLMHAFGPMLKPIPEARPPESIRDMVAGLPEGTRYVLCVLRPLRDFHLDAPDLEAALRSLGVPEPAVWPAGDYVAIAGLVGRGAATAIGSTTPFQTRVRLDGVDVEIRMESWLSQDTIRRMGFAHVIAARHHALIVERGVSFAAFGADGRPIRARYVAGIFAPQPRYRLSP